MRGIVETAVGRRVTVLMGALAVLAFGLVGYGRLPLELFPDIAYPSLTVQTDFPDTAPQEIEFLVTRPVEEAVGVLRGLQSMHSVSRAGVSEVTLEFDWDSDMDLLSMDIRERLDRLALPEGTEDPVVLRFDPSLDPIMRLALSGPGALTDMRNLAERKLKNEFETLEGVASAQVKGGLEEEVHVDVDQERLAALGLTLAQIELVVGVSNINQPGGALRSADSHYLIRTMNEFQAVEEIGGLIVREEPAPVRVRDVATVTLGAKERDEITRVNGRECVEISIYKEGDANAVRAAAAVRERLAAWQDKLPEGHELSVLFDQSRFIQNAVAEVRQSALIGGVLAVIVLFLFLRDFRSTLIVSTSIPLSVIATFMLMYRMKISLNIMSLGGLTLGIGMLVDNAIVVLESIFRKRQAGLNPAAAAVEGTSEVAAAIVASTLTTVAVFLPIVFVEGVAGQLFKDQALTVTLSLLASLVVAVTMIPMLAGLGRRSPAPAVKSTQVSSMTPTIGRTSKLYDRFLQSASRHRALTLLGALVVFAGALGSLRWIDRELIPPLSEGEFFFEVKMPEGASLAATDRVVGQMEGVAADTDGVERHYATIGSRLVAGGQSLQTKAEHLGQLNLVMERGVTDEDELAIANDLRQRFEAIPDVAVQFGRPAYFSMKTPVEVIVFGDDLETLRSYSVELAEGLAATPVLADVRSSLEAGNPELQVVFDRSRVAALGLDMRTLSETLRGRVQGVVPTRFKETDRQIDIRIRNAEAHRASATDVKNLVVPGPGGMPLRLQSVAEVRLSRGPAEIHRIQQQRAAVVTAGLTARSLGAAERAVRQTLDEVPPPAGLSVELGGQNREMQVSFASLRFALALAIFLVYLVMAATFESLVHPLIVLATIPLATVGVAAGLLVTRTPLSVIVFIGTIMLVGIVVNNAIVLIDAINRRRRAGLAKEEAVVSACHLRLRPILMTTLTTILAMLPMALAFGDGAELRAPLAITVASGLLFGMVLTLVVIPVAYLVVPSSLGALDPHPRPEPVTP